MAFLVKEVLDGVDRGNKKPPICGRFLCRREPSDGLEPSTPFLTMEVSVRHARTRAATSDTVLPAKSASVRLEDASRDVARVVSDVSVLCPRFVV
jgi:hypothetical protein